MRPDVGESAGDDTVWIEPVVASFVVAVEDDVGLLHTIIVHCHLDLHNDEAVKVVKFNDNGHCDGSWVFAKHQQWVPGCQSLEQLSSANQNVDNNIPCEKPEE